MFVSITKVARVMNDSRRAIFSDVCRIALLVAVAVVFVSSANAVTVTPALTPTAADNDFTRINSAVQSATPGTTITLDGVFDWTETNAAASWALGSDGATGGAFSDDDFTILAPLNLNGVTITASAPGAATIQGPGDLPLANLEGVFQFFAGGTNQNWTISNIRFLDFDNAIGFYFAGGPTNIYNGTQIVNNYFLVARDLNATVAPTDVNQNIAIHFSFGTNQIISGNTIEFHGDGVSDSANARFSTEVGMQSNTSGGSAYDGLQISNNVLRVLNAQSADPETILGIWENSHGHSSNITVSGNSFVNLAPGNNPALNLQRAFRLTSHSSSTTTVTYSGNNVSGANIGFQWIAGSNFAGNQPIKVVSNTIANGATGLLVQSNGVADMSFNRIVGNTLAGVNNASGIVTAENNWWGCNFGPGVSGAGCASTPNSVVGTVDSAPWLTLTSTATPTSVSTGGSSTAVAKLTINSDAVDTTASGTVPNGTPVGFAGTLGTVAPSSSSTVAASASTTFTAGVAAGAGGVASTVDGQTVNAPISIAFSCNNVSIPTNIQTRRNVAVSVPIMTDDVTGRDIISFDYRVTYNPAVLSFVGPNQTGTLSSGMVITVNPTTPGLVIVSGFGTAPLTSAGVLLNLDFTAIGAIGTSTPVNFTSFAFNEGVPCVATTNGNVSIISGNVSGSVTYANAVATTAVPHTTLSGAGSVNVSTQSDLTGAYTLNGFGTGPYVVTPSKTGDVNGITSFDSALIAQRVVDLITLTPTQMLAADVSSSNTVTSFDAALIAQWVVLIPNIGNTGSWKFIPASRSYPDVEADQAAQDYSAILMGEVSGNWVPPTSLAGKADSDQVDQLAPQAVNVSSPTITTTPGSPIFVPINVGDTTGSGIISYQFDIVYDPAVITPTATPCNKTGSLSANMSVVCNVPSAGLLKVAAFDVNPLAGSGILLRLAFTVTATSTSSSPIDIQNFKFNEDPLLLGSVTDGVVNVNVVTAAGVEVSGQLVSSTGTFSPGTTVVLTDESGAARSVRANNFGNFRFEGVPSGHTYVLTVRSRDLVFEPHVIEVSDSVTGIVLVGNSR